MTTLSHATGGRSPVPAAPETKAQRELHALVARTDSTRKQRSIERVWAALEDMRTRKEQDFSVASVAKAIARLGYPGPKYQSMRNKEGADFRALIDVYRELYGSVPGPREGADEDENLPLAISDVAIQQRVRIELRKVRALEERNRMLHEEVVRLSSAMAAPAPAVMPSVAGGSVFTPDEVRAVERFLTHMEVVGLRRDDDTGCILDRRSDREIAPPYFLDALRRIVGTSGPPRGDG